MEVVWKITDLDYYNDLGDLQNVIYNVHWKVIATEGEYSAFELGITTFSKFEYEESSFIPFNELTEAQIIDWVKQHINSSKIELTPEELSDIRRPQRFPRKNVQDYENELIERINKQNQASTGLPW